MVNISSVVYAAIIGALFMSVFGMFLADTFASYAPTDYDSSQISAYDKLNQTYALSRSLYGNETASHPSAGAADILGDLVMKGITSLKVTWMSFSLFTDMADVAAEQLSLPFQFKAALISILLLSITFFFIGLKLRKDI